MLLAGSTALAQTYYWTTPSGTGGNGVWDTVAAKNWGPDMTGNTSSLMNWTTTGTDTAEFYTGTGAVTVNNTQSVGNLNFDAGSGYSLSGGTLNLSPSGGIITVNGNAQIGSVLTGTNLTIAGGGMLTLGNVQAYSGSTIISGGTLQLAAPAGVNMQWTANSSNGIPSGTGALLGASAAGVVPLANWNNNYSLSGGTFQSNVTLSTVVDSNNNSVSGMSIQFNGGLWSYPSQSLTNSTLKLLSSGLENGQISVTNIPYASYNVYVYVSGWSGGRLGYMTLNENAGLYTSGGTVGFTVSQNASQSSLTTQTAPTSGQPLLTDVEFAGASRGNFQLNWVNTGGAGDVMVSAIQIVNNQPASQLPTGTTVQLGAAAGTATLDLNGVSQQVAALSDNAGYTNGLVTNNASAPATLTLSSAGGSTTFSGPIQNGAGGGTIHLTMSGNGTQVLAGNNTYSGGTSITGGTLQIGDGAANAGALPGNVVVSSTAAGALTFNTPAAMSLAYSGNISGAGGVTKAGSGTLKVASLQSYNGPTIISGGTVQLSPQVGVNLQLTASPTSNLITSGVAGAVPLANWNNNYSLSGGTFQYNANLSSVVDSNNNSVSGMSIAFAGGGPYANLAQSATNNTLKLLSGGLEDGHISVTNVPYSAYDVYVYVSGYSSNRTGYMTLNENAGGYTSGSQVAFTVSQNASQNSLTTLTAASPASGQPLLTDVEFAGASGSGFTINWSNTGTLGAVMVSGIQIVNEASGGKLPAGTAVQLGAASGTPTLDLYGANQQIASLSDNAGYTNGLVTNNGAAGSPAILTLNSAGGSTTFSGAIQDGPGGGRVGLALAGNAVQVLAGSNNTYSGGTSISGGTLQIGDGVANAGSLPGNVALSTTAAGALTFNTPAAMSLTYSGNISGAGGLTKTGAGMLKLGSLQAYNGATVISGGTVQLTAPVGVSMQWTGTSANSITSGTAGLISSGLAGAVPLGNWNNNYLSSVFQSSGTVFLHDSNGNVVPAMKTVFSGGGPFSVPAQSLANNTLKLLSGGIEYGNISVQNIPYSSYDVYVYVSGYSNGRTGYMTLNENAGLYTSGGTVGFTVSQSAGQNSLTTLTATTPSSGQPLLTDVEFAGASGSSFQLNWYPQNPAVMISAIQIVNEATSGNLPSGTTVQLGAAGSTPTLDLCGASQQVAALSDNAGYTNGLVTNSVGNGAISTPVTLTLSPASGSATFSGAIQDGAGGGTIHLAMSGNGTQVLAGGNAYSGGTTISGGTLCLTGSANAFSGGTTISGGGLQIGDGAANAGSLPGNVVVSSTAAGALTFNTPAAMSITYSGNISGAGGLTKAGAGTLKVSNAQTYNGPTIITGGTLQVALPAPVGINMQWTANSSNSISSGTVALLGSGTAGAVPLANWNNNCSLSGGTFQKNSTLSSVVDSNNTSVPGMSIQYIGNLFSYPSQSLTNSTLQLLSGGMEDGQINVTGIPYSSYDVYVYVSGYSANRTGYMTLNENAGLYTSGGTVGFTVSQNASQSSLTTQTAPTSGQPLLTDVEFVGASHSNLQLNWSNTGTLGAVMVSAIQIVDAAPVGLPTGTTVQLGAAGGTPTLDLNGVNQQVVALSDNAGYTNGLVTNSAAAAPATLTLRPASGATTFSGAIQDGGSTVSLAVNGSGTQVLAGSNTYSGNTAISSGTLQIGDGRSGESLASPTISNSGTLVFNHADTLTYAGTIGGPGSLTKYGSGTLILSGTDNTYMGGTDVEGGTLEVLSSDTVPSGSGLTVGVSGTVEIGIPSGAGAAMVATSSFAASRAGAVAAVPEPGTLALLAVGVVAAVIGAWRRRRGN